MPRAIVPTLGLAALMVMCACQRGGNAGTTTDSARGVVSKRDMSETPTLKTSPSDTTRTSASHGSISGDTLGRTSGAQTTPVPDSDSVRRAAKRTPSPSTRRKP
jgi:hypothetical protein